jgi:tRNA threonylcarbamoyladenosine biosynthesis protein TsaB
MSSHLVLGIETSGTVCSVAWWQDGSILREYNLERKNEHAMVLAALIERGFKELGIDPAKITFVAIGSGPGSFTGLRIGMSYAKGFCFGYNIPLIPVTNFELLADLAEHNNFPIYTLIEAGGGNYYTGIFKQNRSKLDGSFLSHVSQLEKLYSGMGQIVVHEEISRGYLKQYFNGGSEILEGEYRAARLCPQGYYNKLHNPILNLNEIEPLYLQKFAGVS